MLRTNPSIWTAWIGSEVSIIAAILLYIKDIEQLQLKSFLYSIFYPDSLLECSLSLMQIVVVVCLFCLFLCSFLHLRELPYTHVVCYLLLAAIHSFLAVNSRIFCVVSYIRFITCTKCTMCM